MKFVLSQFFIVSILFFPLCSFTNIATNSLLCKDNEELLFSFRLVNSKKTVCLCKDKEDKYLVYRFGTNKKIELEYPKRLDASSWKAFTLNGQKRFGGKMNAGFLDYTLTFYNSKVKYILFERKSDEDNSREVGLSVIINAKESMLKGDYKTKKGTLLRLDDEQDKISNTANDE